MAQLADRITVTRSSAAAGPASAGSAFAWVDVLDLLAAGLQPQQILDELPDLELEDVAACLRYDIASRLVSAWG